MKANVTDFPIYHSRYSYIHPTFCRYVVLVGGNARAFAIMRSRREILGFMSAGVATAVLPDSADAKVHVDDCRRHAESLAEAMKTEHGGAWRISIDKDFVLVSKQLVSPSSAKL